MPNIRLTPEQAWNALGAAHTGVLTTLRRDGTPVSLPVWFVTLDRTLAMQTPPSTKKVARIRRDSRAAFLIESGLAWAELQGVHLNGRVEIVEDAATQSRIREALAAKYATYRPAAAALPDRVNETYSRQTYLRLHPEGRLLTWDNAKLFGG